MLDSTIGGTLQAGDGKPVIHSHLLLPADSLYRHAPAVLLTDEGDRVYLLRAGQDDQDRADLLTWEATRGGFSVPASCDCAMFRLPKGDTPQ